MMSYFFLGRDAFIDFSVSVTGLSLIIPALFWLFFHKPKNNKGANEEMDPDILFYLIIIPLCFLIAPGTSLLIQKAIGLSSYMNTMIAIPTVLVAVYVFLQITERFQMNGKKLVGAIICFAILILTSSSISIAYDHPLGIELIANTQKISSEVIEICDIVDSNYVLLPEEIYGQIGEYNSGVNAGSLYEVPYDDVYGRSVAIVASNVQAPLFVIRKTYDNPSDIEYYGYYKTAETEHYVIYQRSDE